MLHRLERAAGGLSARALADYLGSNVRAVYRDREALQAAGYPIYNDAIEGDHLWFVVQPRKEWGSLPVTHSEVLAVRCAQRALLPFHETPFFDAIRSLADKLDVLLTPDMRAYSERMDKAIVADSAGRPDYGGQRTIIEELQAAVEKRFTVELHYRAQTGECTSRSVDPYNIWVHRNILYLVAWCHLREEIRTFSVARIRALERTGATFDVKDGYSFEDYARRRFRIMGDGRLHCVRIWFAPEAAIYVGEREWSVSQQIEEHDDGSIELRMEVDGLPEIASWVLSFGPRAQAIAPSELVELVQSQLAATRDRYGIGHPEEPRGAVTPDDTRSWLDRAVVGESATFDRERSDPSVPEFGPAHNIVFTALDLETSSLKNGRMVEVAAAKFTSGQILAVYTSVVRTTAPVTPAACGVHGLTIDDLARAPDAVHVLLELMQFLDGTVIAAHNASFDLNVLARELLDAGLPIPMTGAVDTLALSRSAMPELPSHALDRVREALDLEPDRAHRALADALAVVRILQHCIGQALDQGSVQRMLEDSWVTFDKAIERLDDALQVTRTTWPLRCNAGT